MTEGVVRICSMTGMIHDCIALFGVRGLFARQIGVWH
jgi:hypothetical protein